MIGKLDGKVALITEAGSGMGRAASLLFAQEGAKVAAVDWVEVLQKRKTSDNKTNIDFIRKLMKLSHLLYKGVKRYELEGYLPKKEGRN